jgi:hypothetical protein
MARGRRPHVQGLLVQAGMLFRLLLVHPLVSAASSNQQEAKPRVSRVYQARTPLPMLLCVLPATQGCIKNCLVLHFVTIVRVVD